MAVKEGKIKSILSQSFVDNNENISEDKAGEMIVQCLQKVNNLEEERDGDEKLKAAKQIKKDLESGYSSAIRYEKAKIAFLLDKIDEIQGNTKETEE
jgi:hypothetical protein